MFYKDPIMKVTYTKPKSKKILTVHLTRKYDKGEYPSKALCPDLVKNRYNRWLEIANIIKGHQGIHSQELYLALNLMMNKVWNLNLVLTDTSTSYSTSNHPPTTLSRII
ncbi:unnamed protein product [Lactuca saligna]|uniref:Uncharacterized protein n=1 Tax=Lactuca saligna TaxID=75948 RepID=A0AA35ZEI1_LACSI|nr:unnamed protein product [Lactuca saligna]